MEPKKTHYILLAMVVIFFVLTIGLSLLIIISQIILAILIPLAIVLFFISLFNKSFRKSKKFKKIKENLEIIGKDISKLIKKIF